MFNSQPLHSNHRWEKVNAECQPQELKQRCESRCTEFQTESLNAALRGVANSPRCCMPVQTRPKYVYELKMTETVSALLFVRWVF